MEHPYKWHIKNKRGWLITFCTFFMILPVTGILSCFGIILIELQDEYPHLTNVKAGWIGSLAFGIMFASSPLSTGLFKRYGHRKIALIGVLMCGVGLAASSFAPNVNFLFFTYSLVFGIGSNFVDNTSLHLIGLYFPRKNSARATCFATIGWSIGALSLNPLAEYLCSYYGWRWTYRIFSVFVTVTGLICVITFEPRTTQEFIALDDTDDKKPLETFSEEKKIKIKVRQNNHQTTTEYIKAFLKTFQAPGIVLWFLGNFMLNLSLIFPFVNMVKFMITINISKSDAAFILLWVGVGDFIGRSKSAVIGDHLPMPSIYVYPIGSAVMALATLSLVFATSYIHLLVYAVVIGICTGIVNSMLFKATMDLFGSKLLAESWTISLLAAGFGVMLGPTIAGLSYDKTESFNIAFYCSTGFFVIAMFITLAIPFVQKRANWKPELPTKEQHFIPETVSFFAPKDDEYVIDYYVTVV